MLTYEEIINYCSNYKIKNGNVIDKNTDKEVIDEDIILKVKSSVLLFKEAKEDYQSDIRQFGKTSKSQEDYVKKTMEKFAVNNEENSFGVNKLINAILSSNGHYEEYMSGDDLKNSKFSILVEPKNEYGISFLKMKFREKGLDIDDLKISQDLTELKHNGVSKVIIDYKIKKYEENKQNNNENKFRHSRANELNELEKQKKLAKQNNDEVAYNYAQASIEKIISESRTEVSPEEWDNMSKDEQISFYKTKMKEAKVLNDEDEFNYWNSNLQSLNNENNQNDFSSLIENIKQQINIVSNEYKVMLSDNIIDEKELLVLNTRFNQLKNNAINLKVKASNQNELKIIENIIQMIEIEQQKMNLQDNEVEIHHKF